MFEGMSMGNLDPNMLAYFMGAMGGAISPEGSFGKNLSPAVMAMAGNKMQEANMQKRTNNFASLLQKALAGGGKFSMNSEGFNLKAPNTILKTALEESFGGKGKGDVFSLGSTNIMSPAESPMLNLGSQSQSSLLPFSSDSQADFLSSANLEGLTPEDISTALQMKERVNNRGWERLRDLVNMKYMAAQIENMEQDNIRQWYTTLNKDDRTELQKNFSAFNDDLIAHGKAPVSMERYVMITGNDSWKDYQLAKGDPAFGAFMTAQKKAGAPQISIGDKTREQELARQEADLYAPDYMTKLENQIKADIEAENKVVTAKKGKLSERRENRNKTPEQLRRENRDRITFRTIKKYTEDLKNKYGPANIKIVQNSDGSVSWYRRESDGSGTLIRTYGGR